MEYRTFGEPDYAALSELDRLVQQSLDPAFDQLPEREREGRLCSSQAALKFYERSEHSFVADDGTLQGFILAQSVWQGDRPVVLVRAVVARPGPQETELRRGLLRATVKSAYDSAVYEIHVPTPPALLDAVRQEEAHLSGQYAVIHLGTRAQTAPGEKLTRPGE